MTTMADRRAHYAVVEVPSKELFGFFRHFQDADRCLKAYRAEGATRSELFNLTHSKTPQWVRDLAREASEMSSPEAEIHMGEDVIRIVSRYDLSPKASSLILEDYPWIPDLHDHLDQVPGFVGVTVEAGDPDHVVVKVELDVTEGGTSSDSARSGAYRSMMRLLEDISRFRWHTSDAMKEDYAIAPVYTSSTFVIVSDERAETTSLCWSEGEDVYQVPVEDESILRRLVKTVGRIARDDDKIEDFAATAREELTSAPVPF